MKKPEEIKKGLRWCGGIAQIIKGCSGGCPYYVSNDDGCQQEDLTADALAYIQQLEAQVPKWISVEERLPETHEDGSVDAALVTDGYLIHMAYFSSGKWFYCSSGEMKENMFYEVTHWMPLPEPPKEDAHENG